MAIDTPSRPTDGLTLSLTCLWATHDSIKWMRCWNLINDGKLRLEMMAHWKEHGCEECDSHTLSFLSFAIFVKFLKQMLQILKVV